MSFKTFFLKNILMSFFVSVTCITAAMAIMGSVFKPDVHFGFDSYWSPILFGLAATIPLLVKYSKKELSLRQQIFRNIIHFVLLEAVILSILYFAGALTDYSEAISIAVSVFIIDAAVYLVLWLSDKRIAEDFNKALKKMQENQQ